MKKRFFVVALVAMLAVPAFAQQHCPESDFRVVPVGGGASVRIVEYLGDNWTVNIPPTIRGLPVTHIGEFAFAGMRIDGWGRQVSTRIHLLNVTIPNSVTHIENGAFMGSQLTSVVIPDSVIHIGDMAFHGSNLASLTIGNNVRIIGLMAFAGNQLTSVAIPNSIVEIGYLAFISNRLTSVTIPFNAAGGLVWGERMRAIDAFDPGVTVTRR